MKTPKATQIYGALILAVSAFLIWVVAISPLLRRLGTLGNSADDAGAQGPWSIGWFFGFAYLGMLAVLGVMIYCGIGLVKNRPLPAWTGAEDFPEEERWRGQIVVDPMVTYVRFSLAIFTVLGVILAASQLSESFLGAVPESIRWSVSLLVILPVALSVYVIVVRLLLRGRGYRCVELRYVVGKGTVALLAWLLWIMFFDLAQTTLPPGTGGASGKWLDDPFLMSLAVFLGPIIAAVLFYQITLSLLRYQEIDLDLRRAGLRPASESKKKG